MAQRLQTLLECDLDQDGERRDATTMTFWSSTGVQHEIEVCEDHRKDIDEVLTAIDSFTEYARRIGPRVRSTTASPALTRRRTSRSSGSSGSDGPDPIAVREWATSQGIEVSSRGRISQKVLEQYAAANA